MRYEVRETEITDWRTGEPRLALFRIDDGKATLVTYEGGEPEDQTFNRDLGDFINELQWLAGKYERLVDKF